MFRKLTIVRVGIGWYLFAIFGLAVMYVVGSFLQLSGYLPDLPILSDKLRLCLPCSWFLSIVPMFIVIGLVNGEELG